jgi:uncharacterized protein YecA (UPF0149 family)
MGLFERVASLLKDRDANIVDAKPGRNESCWCGSGKKYKKCHLLEDEKTAAKACSLNCGPT